MTDLDRILRDLFQLADGLLLPDESILEEISRNQRNLSHWNEQIVFQGLSTMMEFLQDLASKNQATLVNAMDQVEWSLSEKSQSQLNAASQNLPSIWELTRHLSNWTIVFIPPLRALDLSGDMELIRCLESTDRHVSILATIMLGYDEFRHVGSIERFRELLNDRPQTALRLEIYRVLQTRYQDWETLRKEIVPNLVRSESQFDIIVENDIQRKKLLSYIRELVVWDIVTQGQGPRRKWASWWV